MLKILRREILSRNKMKHELWKWHSPVVLLWLLFCLTGQACAQTVSLQSLLNEMIDRDTLAQFPSPEYQCRQASSYDRRSVAPDQPGWFANSDRSYFIRTEQHQGRTEHVMLDVDGPGSIVRIWSTWHGPGGGEFSNGTIRFYLDGLPDPVIEGSIASVLDGGGLLKGPLANSVSPLTEYARRGHNLYLPIPFARGCKITYETSAMIDDGGHKGEALYYQINYRLYAQGTTVKSFRRNQITQHKKTIDAVQQRLRQSGNDRQANIKTVSLAGSLESGETRTETLRGSAAIRQIRIQLDPQDQPQALRSTILQLECDGALTLWCPLGALFGRGYQSQPHRTWNTEVTADGVMNCFWVMPFQRECQVTLINLADSPVQIARGDVCLSEWDWDDRSMYFHGTWHQLTEVSTRRKGVAEPGEGAYDVNFVTVEGQGVYVGDTLTIFNGTAGWWGEGDEKIFVDNEAFPSHIGTGTEDYYGYAWCRPEFFEAPFHAQPSGDGNLQHPGLSVNSRYRALDGIPFQKSIHFDMELWHWRDTIVNYAPATFWYARPGATCNIAPDPAAAAKTVLLKQNYREAVFRVPGVLEGESLKIVGKSGGETKPQTLTHLRWSDATQIWWIDGQPGDQLLMAFPVEKGGRYEVVANLTKAVDYAIVRLSVNDGPARTFDRYHPQVKHDRLSLGVCDLSAGENRLTVEIDGANDQAVKRHMFGLDYLHLVPQP